jgi:cytochrome c oxidase subunit 2
VGRIVRASSVVVVAASCGGLSPATREGREIEGLWVVFLWAGLGVAVIVSGLILWTTIRYRRRPGDDDLPPQFREHVGLEIAYTLIPIVIVAVLFLLTVQTESTVERATDRPAASVEVEAHNWSWRFTYRGSGVTIFGTPDEPPEAVLPVGLPVRISLTSPDVIHSFFVPAFLFKRDAIPGRTTTFDLTIDRAGLYQGKCAEFCGLDHWRMRFTIRAVPPAEFEAWLADQAVPT